MNITVHRGSCEIGGSCVELQSGVTRVILDLGMPLVNAAGTPFSIREHATKGEELFKSGVVPQVEGLYRWQKPAINAVLISHAHQDHCGFIPYVHPDIPVYLSEGTHKLMAISELFSGAPGPPANKHLFQWPSRFSIGDFKVTPHLVDHSSFSAFAFEIEACGKRVFYSGDFREHGHIGNALDVLYDNVAPGVDLLLMEGTTLGRGNAPAMTESALSEAAKAHCQDCNKAVLVFQASQNVSRAVSFYKAAHSSSRLFVVDFYTAHVLTELSRCKGGDKLPHPGPFQSIRVWYPNSLSNRMVKAGHKKLLDRYQSYKITPEEMATQLGKIMLFVRPGMQLDLEELSRQANLCGSILIYSLWEGYKEKPPIKRFLDTVQNLGVTLTTLHTSGHADTQALHRMIARLKPHELVPIHTFHAAAYASIFQAPIRHLADGELYAF